MDSELNDPARRYAAAVAALEGGRWAEAQALAESLLPLGPRHAGAHALAGVAALRQRRMTPALANLRKAVALAPERADYAVELANALAAAGSVREALDLADRTLARLKPDAAALDALGVVYAQANEHQRAADLFRRAAHAMPGQSAYHFNLGAALTFCGDMAGAEREYETCIALEPRHWLAHLSLSQLRRQGPDNNHVERLLARLRSDGYSAGATLYLNLALAKEFEDLGEYQRSFGHLVAGKATQQRTRAGSRERDRAMFAALMDAFPEAVATTSGCSNSEPIFIIGMPRTGTTLVERILSCHPHVHSAGELSNFGIALKRASGSRTEALLDADTIARSKGLDWAKVGAEYLASTRPGTGHTPHFVDKLPHNFLHAGHISRALPQARIICVRRNPMDTCLSNFRQLFALDSPYHDYSYDLLDIGHYYLMFDQLMAHWQCVLPGRILQVDYESVVDSQEAETRRLLEFCGLPWDEACMSFEKNRAPVATASATQVRSPIYRSAMQRWKRYEDELAPLRALFAEAGLAIG